MNANPPHIDARSDAATRLASMRRFLAAESVVEAGNFQYLRELAERILAAAPADPEAQFDRARASCSSQSQRLSQTLRTLQLPFGNGILCA